MASIYNLSIQLLGHYFLNSCFLSENFQDGMRVGGLLPLTHYTPFSTAISFKTNLAKYGCNYENMGGKSRCGVDGSV